ncbi:MAG: hypothetical protein COB16_11530 [Rhodobacteraceae bacterium]|nr:MAG: hypothetical protein COB16_19620 [Paracoccaceae bacterium]PCJ07310.1 MAG: hypothetical protein COB16_11530 [Paracoccaceae bacterium]
MRQNQRRTRGLTLIELVAAMALFALVAVMGLQALTANLRMRDRLTQMEQQAGELSLGLALLRNDLSALLPVLFHPPGGGSRSAIHLSDDGLTLSFSVSGQPELPPGPGRDPGLGLHRVEWRLDVARQQLMRRVWPVLSPSSDQSVSPEVGYLSGVTDLGLRSLWPQLGWLPGVVSSAPRAAPELGGGDTDGVLIRLADSYSDTLPEAVELILQIEGLGPVRLLEGMR